MNRTAMVMHSTPRVSARTQRGIPATSWVEISQEDLLRNFSQLNALLQPSVRFMAVVKSNANGHGMLEVSRALAQSVAESQELWFGVETFEEALAIHTAIPDRPVLILGYVPSWQLAEVRRTGIRLTAYNAETVDTLDAMASTSAGPPLRIHVKVETGMTRQGIASERTAVFIQRLQRIPGVFVEGLSTHFATSDEAGSEYMRLQCARFDVVREELRRARMLPPITHAAASAAVLQYPEAQYDLVRVGHALFGLWPSLATQVVTERQRVGVMLTPVLTWKTIVAQAKRVPAGTPVSYGCTERVDRDSTIAVLPVGYWDGYDRRLSSRGFVLVNGRRCKIVGRVCNNMTMVDVTDAGRVVPEDEVVLLGRQEDAEVTAGDLAEWMGTINYEVTTRINPLLPRVIV